MALFKRRTKSDDKGKASEAADLPDAPMTDMLEVNLSDTSPVKTRTAPVKLTLEDNFVRVEEPHIAEAPTAHKRPKPSLSPGDKLDTSYTGQETPLSEALSFKSPEFNALLPAGLAAIDVTPLDKHAPESSAQNASSEPRANVLSDVESETLIKTNEDLQAKISAQNTQIRALRDDILHITAQLDDAHQVMNRTRQDLSVSDTTLAQRDMDLRDALMIVSTLTEKTKVQSSEVHANAAQIDILRTKLSEAGKTLESLKGQRAALKQAERNNAIMIQQLTAVQVEITGYKRKVDEKIKTYLEKIHTQSTQIAALKTELAETKNLVSETAETLTLLRDRSDTQSGHHMALEKRVLDQSETIRKAELELTEHRNKNVTLARRLNDTLKDEALRKDSALSTASERTQLSATISTLEAENSALKAQLTSALDDAKAQSLAAGRVREQAAKESALNADDFSRVQTIIAQQSQKINALQARLDATPKSASPSAPVSLAAQTERYADVRTHLEQSRAKLARQAPAAEPDIKPARQDPAPSPGQDAPPKVSIEDMILDYKLGVKTAIG